MKTVIAYLVSAVCTVLLYHLLFEEHTTLFYVNVVAACAVEGAIFLSFPILTDESPLTFKKAATQYVVVGCALLLFLWTSVCSLTLENEEELNTLYIGQLVIALIFVLLYTVTEVGGSAMEKKEAELQTTIKQKKVVALSVNNFWLDAKDALCHHTDWEEDTLKQMRLVLDRIAAIPAGKIERNGDVISELNTKLSELIAMFQDFDAEATDATEKQKAITRKVERMNNYVVTIKSIL